jgi:putative endonuclease
MKELKKYYMYIMTNKNNTVLYTGFTSELDIRCHKHKIKFYKGFTAKYNIDKLVYYETFDSPMMAIAREKQVKGYSRKKKEYLINKVNPQWRDLYNNGIIEKN